MSYFMPLLSVHTDQCPFIHSSRRQFTPEGHWHMTSQFDLSSFVQTAIFEDERLQAEGEVPSTTPAAAPTVSRTREGEDDDEDDSFVRQSTWRRRGLARPTACSRQKILSKRQLALISPRLGVLNNSQSTLPPSCVRTMFAHLRAVHRQFPLSFHSKLESPSSANSSTPIIANSLPIPILSFLERDTALSFGAIISPRTLTRI